MGGYSSKSSGSPSGGGTKKQAKNFQKKNRKNIVTKAKEGISASIKSRRKMAYNVANIIPGMEEGLKKNREDYRGYLKTKKADTSYLNVDDKQLTSFNTYEKLIATKTNKNILGYADYLAEKKQNYNLKYAGNVGGINNKEGIDSKEGIEIANEMSKNSTILSTAKIQKNAANKIEGPTDIEMSAVDKSLATKRKGRRITNVTGSTGLAKITTLNKKTLLG